MRTEGETMKDQLRPCCKWCTSPLPEYRPGGYVGTFDPISKWSAISLTEQEATAVAETERLFDEGKAAAKQCGDLCVHSYTELIDSYLARQDTKESLISEHCFDRLLFESGLICMRCYERWADEDATDLH
jgi:hypothetical protein